MNDEITNTVTFLFNRAWNSNVDNDEETDNLQAQYDELVKKYGWDKVFGAIEQYMKTNCKTSESVCNFAHLFWEYSCPCPKPISNPYEFIAYLYYFVDSKPWEYDCAEVYEGIVYNLLSNETDYNHNPFMNPDYYPEKDPNIVSEIEKLRSKSLQ